MDHRYRHSRFLLLCVRYTRRMAGVVWGGSCEPIAGLASGGIELERENVFKRGSRGLCNKDHPYYQFPLTKSFSRYIFEISNIEVSTI